jgi:hypothetical protein
LGLYTSTRGTRGFEVRVYTSFTWLRSPHEHTDAELSLHVLLQAVLGALGRHASELGVAVHSLEALEAIASKSLALQHHLLNSGAAELIADVIK